MAHNSEINPNLNPFISKSFSLYEDQENKRVFVSKRGPYQLALNKLFNSLILYTVSDQTLEGIEIFDTLIYNTFVELDSNQIFYGDIVGILHRIIRTEYLPTIEQNSPSDFLFRYDTLIAYTTRIVDNILKFNFILGSSIRGLLDNISQYSYYQEGDIVSSTKQLLSHVGSYSQSNESHTFKQKFKSILDSNSRSYYEQINTKLNEINFYISDTKDPLEQNLSQFYNISTRVLKKSWGGEGLDIYKNLMEIYELGQYIGRSEKSVSGEIKLRNDFINIYNSCVYANKNVYEYFYITPNKNHLGLFKEIFFNHVGASKHVPGLSFLKQFNTLKSFQKDVSTDKIISRYESNALEEKTPPKILEEEQNAQKKYFSNKILEEIEKNVINLGDIIHSIKNSLNEHGLLRYYEGLGSLKYVIELFGAVFPSRAEQIPRAAHNLNYGGITGALYSLSENFSESYTEELGEELGQEVIGWANKLKNKLENLHSIIGITGYREGQFIPNLNFEPSPRSLKDIKEYFLLRGYSQEETEKIVSSQDVNSLLTTFAYKMDSNDIKSLVKGFDLLGGIYTIGGDKPIYAILDYLNTPDENGLRNIFAILNKSQDRYLRWNSFKYGELIGTLISVFGVEKTSLEALIPILDSRNDQISQSLNLISRLNLTTGSTGINLDIDYLGKLVNQSGLGQFEDKLDLDCAQANKENPLELRKLLRLIDGSRGLTSEEDLRGIFNNNSGITPKELYGILEPTSGYSLLGGILSGLEGGNFTTLTRNVYLSGLSYLFSPPIVQTKSRKVSQPITMEGPVSLHTLFTQLEKLIVLLRIFVDSYKNNISFTGPTPLGRSLTYEPIINAINKDINIYTNIFEFMSPGGSILNRYRANTSTLIDTISRAVPALPPGLGNKPLLIKSSQGVISPELGYYITTRKFLPRDLRFDSTPKVPQFFKYNFNTLDSFSSRELFTSEPQTFSTNYEQEDILLYNFRDSFSTQVDSTLAEKTNQKVIARLNQEYIDDRKYSQVGKSTYYRGENKKTAFGSVSPVDMCTKMGTNAQACEEYYKNYNDADCENKFQSINPHVEFYYQMPVYSENNIPISRPWGFASEVDYEEKVLNFYKKVPEYWKYLPLNTLLHDKSGEPTDIIDNFDLDITFDTYSLIDTKLMEKHFISKFARPTSFAECRSLPTAHQIICQRLIGTLPRSNFTQIYNIYHESNPRMVLKNFNYLVKDNNQRINFDSRLDNGQMSIYFNTSTGDKFKYLKLTNTGIVNWSDIWFKEGQRININIQEVNLSNSEFLEYITWGGTQGLQKLTANNCASLTHLNLVNAPELTHLELNNCTNLSSISFGINKNLQGISLKGCELSPQGLENILSALYPVYSRAVSIGLGKIKYESVLDLRGNFIDWENRKIASKIRMMLANNFMVIWDNDPPHEVIPIQYYRSIIF